MFLRKNRYGIDLAGGRSPRKYEVSACATAGNNGSSMRTLVFGLLALSMPAFQSRSSNRSPRTSAAPRPYVASSNRTGLNLTLLVTTQHQGVFGWIEIQTDDGLQFLGKVRVGGNFEGFHQMRFESVPVPDAPHRGLAEAHRGRHGPRGPVGGVGGLLLRGFVNHPLYLGRRDAGRAPRTWRVLLQSHHPRSEKPLAPTRCFVRCDSQLRGDFLILPSRSCQQHDAGTLDQTNRKRPRPRALLQGFFLFGFQYNRASNAHGGRTSLL